MKVYTCAPMEPNPDNTPINVFLQDYSHIGENLGTNVSILFPKHASEVQLYIIIVNRITGEKIQIDF